VPARVRDPAECDIDPGRAPVGAEQAKVVAGSASAVQDPQVRAPGGRPLEERRHEAPETVKPEMILLGAGRGFEKSIHYGTEIDSVYSGR
jgi:hypothetical protein